MAVYLPSLPLWINKHLEVLRVPVWRLIKESTKDPVGQRKQHVLEVHSIELLWFGLPREPFFPSPCPSSFQPPLRLYLLSLIGSCFSPLTAFSKKESRFSSLSGGATNIWRIHFLSGPVFSESFLLGLRRLLSSVSWGCLSGLDP